MVHNVAYKGFELYLGLSFVMHALIGFYNSNKKQKFIMADPAKNGRLAISGTVLTVFVIVHVMSLRLGSTEGYMTEGEHPIRDFHAQTSDHLSSPAILALYLLGIASVGIHLWVGWGKTVFKFNLSNPMRQAVTALGNMAIVPMCVGFAAVAVYFHLHSNASAGTAAHTEL